MRKTRARGLVRTSSGRSAPFKLNLQISAHNAHGNGRKSGKKGELKPRAAFHIKSLPAKYMEPQNKVRQPVHIKPLVERPDRKLLKRALRDLSRFTTRVSQT